MYTNYFFITHSRLAISLVLLLSSSFFSANAQCNADFDLGPDTTLCASETLNLQVPAVYDAYLWQNFSMNPNFLVSSPGTYYCQTSSLSVNNLVTNGSFQSGNTGFTTDYTYYPIADVFGPQASYGIINNANTWFNPFNPCTDHTTGSGLMMVIDGSAFNGGNDAIWCQNIPVQAGVNYRFAYWIQSVTNSGILANIQVRINGSVVDTELAPFGACNWQEREVFWTSPSTGNVNFCLYDLELAGNGNDFALDDISVLQVCTYQDTIVVGLSPNDTTSVSAEICPNDSLFLEGAWQFNPGFYYDLVVGANCDEVIETQLLFANIDTNFVQVEICPGDSFFVANAWQFQVGLYYDVIAGTPCNEVTATELIWFNLDTTRLTIEICQNDSIFLSGAWQSSPGLYYDVIAANPCNEIIETLLIINPLPSANAGNDLTVLYEQIVSLNASNAPSNSQFLWTSSNNFTSTNQTIEVEVLSPIQTYYLEVSDGGCTSFDTVSIFGVQADLGIWVPNAFTPNADGINDLFRVINADDFQQISMKIYNRWGELVFYSEGDSPTWFGDYKNGDKCPMAVYSYYIEALPFNVSEQMRISGTLSLIR